jgi:two-component system, NtrC family, sensor kinase
LSPKNPIVADTLSMKKRSHLGIAWRLSVLINFLMLSAFGIFASGIYLFGESSIEQRMTEMAYDSLDMANAALTQTVWLFDNAEMNKIADALIQRNQGVIIGVRIVSSSEEVLSNKVASAYEGTSFDDLGAQDNNMRFEKKLTKNDEIIARVQIIFTSSKLKSEFHHQMKFLLFIIGLLALVCSATVFWATYRYLNPPLKGLVKVAEQIQTGDYQIETGYWTDEFSILFQAFASAATVIQRRDRALKEHAENLEIQVQLRTRELDAQRMQMVNSSRLASLGEVSAGIAHEINNPLAIIQGKAEILLKQMPPDSLQRNHVEKIILMVKRMSTIVKGLRTFARDGSKDVMRTFHLTPFLNDLKDLCHARMVNSEIDFSINCPEKLDGFGREVQISQVLINLLNNSMDAIQDQPKKWIRLEVFKRGAHLVFAVTDNGPGVPADLREKIMEPFFTTKPVGKGTGMGLSISIGICRDHGGDLQYVAGYPHTRFEVVLPQAQTGIQAA